MEHRISNRQLKVANLIKQSVIAVLARGKQLDVRLLETKITITNVKVSPDLKLATCYFLPFANDANPNDLTEAFELSKFAIRKQVTEDINLKFSPEIRFQYDYGIENASEVDAMLRRLNH